MTNVTLRPRQQTDMMHFHALVKLCAMVFSSAESKGIILYLQLNCMLHYLVLILL